MMKFRYDMGREDTLEGVFYLFAIKLIGGPGYTHKQTTNSEAKLCGGELTLQGRPVLLAS